MHDVIQGVRLVLRNWTSSALIFLVLFCAVGGTAVALSSALSASDTLRAGAGLRHANGVSFFPFYKDHDISPVSSEVLGGLADRIDGGEAYTAVLFNVAVDDPTFADGHEAVILVGDALDRLFPWLPLCHAPCAMRGHSLPGDAITVHIGSHDLVATRSLPASTTLLDPSAGQISLDRDVVVRLPAEDLTALDPMEREEATTRAVLLDPSDADLSQYVRDVDDDGIALIPRSLRSSQSRDFNDIVAFARVQVTAFVAFSVIGCMCLVALVSMAIRREVPGLMISRMSGASAAALTRRIAVYATAVTALGPMSAWVIVRGIAGDHAGVVVAAALVVLLGTTALAAARAVRMRDVTRA